MFERFRAVLVPLLRLPGAPAAPFGEPASVRVFRAGRNFYRLRLAIWSVGQIATLVGIVVSLGFLTQIEDQAEAIKAKRKAAAVVAEKGSDPESSSPVEPDRAQRGFWDDPNNPLGRLIDREPWWLFPLITGLEFLGIVFYVAQLPITYALVRLEYESHWYIVTDRSLRIRSGVVRIQESTMSFANVQQVTVSQGPLQRLLNLADVRVQSAGGGGQQSENDEEHSMHAGTFHSVDNAPEIRDLVLDRLRKFRAAGLGDPDEVRDAAAKESETAAMSFDTIAAARELLAVARDLRRSRVTPDR